MARSGMFDMVRDDLARIAPYRPVAEIGPISVSVVCEVRYWTSLVPRKRQGFIVSNRSGERDGRNLNDRGYLLT